jgi:Pregnancy-associated plasma protein-A
VRGAPRVVPVHFVTSGGARLTREQAAEQVCLLDAAFATGLPGGAGSPGAPTSQQPPRLWRFELRSVQVDDTAAPMCAGSQTEALVKSAWRARLLGSEAQQRGQQMKQQHASTLVVYLSYISPSGSKMPCGAAAGSGYRTVFGYASSPQQYLEWQWRGLQDRDGIVIDPRYLRNVSRSGGGGGGGSNNRSSSNSSSSNNSSSSSSTGCAPINDPDDFAGAVKALAGTPALRGAQSGAQLVHEVGHWLGLLHTFDGGCASSRNSGDAHGDLVSDTPAEAHPTRWPGVDVADASGACVHGTRDSCPGSPGADVVRNYMSSNNLACAATFTPGQQVRMLWVYDAVRRPRSSVPP